jgi:transcriptional regulator with XRE-family HTH domain
MTERSNTRLSLPFLRAWRLNKAMSQEELARVANLGVSTIIRAEQGARVNFLTIQRLAEALDIQREQLLSQEPIKQ